MSRTQVRDTLQGVLASGRSNGISTPSPAVRSCFTAGTLIPYVPSSLQAGSGACGHPTALFARSGVCTRASYRGGNRVLGAGSSERGRESGQGSERGWGRTRGREQ